MSKKIEPRCDGGSESKQRGAKAISILESILGEKSFFGGDTFGFVDIAAA